MILEILLIALIVYLAYQVIMIPIWAFGFWGTLFGIFFGIPLLIIFGGWFFNNIVSVYAIASVLAVFTIIAVSYTHLTLPTIYSV